MLKFQNNNTTIIATFEDFIFTVYVIIDDLYHQFAPDEVIHRRRVLDAKLSDPEIITISLCGELAGIDSENAWFHFVKRNYRHLFPNLCSRSRFNRTRRALMQTTERLRQKMLSAFPVPVSPYCIIDSFPLAVCKFGRARFCRSFRGYGADYGKCPSKKGTYFDYKVHVLITLEGYITSFEITPVSVDDRQGLRDIVENQSGLTILADKGYVGEALMLEMQEQKYNFENGQAEIGRLQVGDLEARGHGIGGKSFVLAMAVGFKKLGLKRIYASVNRENLAAYKSYTKIGFQVCGSHASPVDGIEDEIEIDEKRWSDKTPYVHEITLFS